MRIKKNVMQYHSAFEKTQLRYVFSETSNCSLGKNKIEFSAALEIPQDNFFIFLLHCKEKENDHVIYLFG